MAEIEKFEGRILQVGNENYLCSYEYLKAAQDKREKLTANVAELKQQIEDLENEKIAWQAERAELLQEQRQVQEEKRTGTVAGKEGRKSTLTDTEKGQILLLRENGHSLRDIAAAFDVSHETVRSAEMELKRAQEEKNVLTAQEVAQVVEWHKAGYTTENIADHIGKSDRAVRTAVADAVGVLGFCGDCGKNTKQFRQTPQSPLSCPVCGLHFKPPVSEPTEPVGIVEPVRATGSKMVDLKAGRSNIFGTAKKTESIISSDFRTVDK